MKFWGISAVALSVWALLTGASVAQGGHPLMVVKPDGEECTLELDELDAMQQVEFVTNTIWTEGPNRFSGVGVLDLLESLEVEGETLRMSALNDYSVEMPMAELEDGAPIVATRMNGDTLSVREKGPYWIIFPFDSDPKYQTEAKYAQSVWQLTKLEVLD